MCLHNCYVTTRFIFLNQHTKQGSTGCWMNNAMEDQLGSTQSRMPLYFGPDQDGKQADLTATQLKNSLLNGLYIVSTCVAPRNCKYLHHH